MPDEQKVFIITTRPDDERALDELNIALGRGWRIVQIAPMGGAGTGRRDDGTADLCFAALVVAERRSDESDPVAVATAESELSEDVTVEDVLEKAVVTPEPDAH